MRCEIQRMINKVPLKTIPTCVCTNRFREQYQRRGRAGCGHRYRMAADFHLAQSI